MKYQNNAKLRYMGTDSFFIQIKIEDSYEDIANDVKKWLDKSNYEVDRALPIGMNKNVVRLMKNELAGRNKRNKKMYNKKKT